MRTACVLLLLLCLSPGSGAVARAESPAAELLAPQRADLLAHLTAAEDHLRDAEALGAALGRIHNHLAQADRLRCEAPDAPSLAWRTALLGQAWRDALQSARAEATRVARMQTAPTVAPLLGAVELARIEQLQARLASGVLAWQAASGWQQVYVQPWARRCPWTTPEARPGLTSSAPAAAQERQSPVAVLAVGEGAMLCPARIPTTAAGVAAVLDTPRACVAPATGDCGCAPQEVLPGAVLELPHRGSTP